MPEDQLGAVENDIACLAASAEDEKSRYQWEKAAALYMTAIKMVPATDTQTAADLHFKLAESCYLASYCAKTLESAERLFRLSATSCKTAGMLYDRHGNQGRVLECEVMVSLLGIPLTRNVKDIILLTKSNVRKLERVIEIYAERHDPLDYSRAVVLRYYIHSFPVYLLNTHEEIYRAFESFKPSIETCWNLLKKNGGVKNHIQLTFFIFGCLTWLGGAGYNLSPRLCEREILRAEKIGAELLTMTESTEDELLLALSYILNGMVKWFLAVLVLEKDSKRKTYFDQVVAYADKGLTHARNVGFNFLISLFYSHRSPALLWGNASVDLNQVLADIHLSIKHDNLHLQHFFHLNYIFASNIYTELAHLPFFPVEDRKVIAQKSITVLKNTIKETGLGTVTDAIPMSAALHAGMCLNYVHLAEFSAEKSDQENYIKKAIEAAEKAKIDASGLRGGLNQSYAYHSIWFACKSLADISNTKKDKVQLLAMAIDAAEKRLENPVLARTGDLSAKIRLGDLYLELGGIAKDDKMLEKAHMTFLNALEDSMERGYVYMAASAQQRLAFVEEQGKDHTAAADRYLKAFDAYNEALTKLTNEKIIKKVKDLSEYSRAWHLIAVARSCHDREAYRQAEESYQAAAEILEGLPDYFFEAVYYSAWAKMEAGTLASKEEQHDEAVKKFDFASEAFEHVKRILNNAKEETLSLKERKRIERLEAAARLRTRYSLARAGIERGAVLGKRGNKLEAAREYHRSALILEEIYTTYELDGDKETYLGPLKLCQALEKMELAENDNNPECYQEAAQLFEAAGEVLADKKKKLVASGNAAFCRALANGCRFDEIEDTETKRLLYTKIKKHLRHAATFYQKCEFVNGADWALAASTYFDGVWHLMLADEVIDLNEKQKLLEGASQYLKSAAEIFGRSGYGYMKKEIQDRLDMLNEESEILLSAMDAIVRPTITGGFTQLNPSALAAETGSSVSISEMRKFSREMEEPPSSKLEKKYSIEYLDDLEKSSSLQQTTSRVGVAQIGGLEDFFEEKGEGLFGLPASRLGAIRHKVRQMCETAHANHVDILLFPEMTIDLNYTELLEDLLALAGAYNMVIIPGAYHDIQTRANICRVIGPEGIICEQKKHIPAIIGFGENKHKENIQVDTPGRITICNTRYGRIAVTICRDFLDMDLRVELKNASVPVDIILNTAFTPVTSDFEAVHFEARRSIYAYCFFCNYAFFGHSSIYSPEKDRHHLIVPPQEEKLIFKDVDLFNLRSERKKWEKIRDSEAKFIQSTR